MSKIEELRDIMVAYCDSREDCDGCKLDYPNCRCYFDNSYARYLSDCCSNTEIIGAYVVLFGYDNLVEDAINDLRNKP